MKVEYIIYFPNSGRPEAHMVSIINYTDLFERSEFLVDTPHKKNLRVCPRARVK